MNIVIAISTMVYYYRDDAAFARISSDKLWELRGNHRGIWTYIGITFHEDRNTGGKH